MFLIVKVIRPLLQHSSLLPWIPPGFCEQGSSEGTGVTKAGGGGEGGWGRRGGLGGEGGGGEKRRRKEDEGFCELRLSEGTGVTKAGEGQEKLKEVEEEEEEG